MQEIISQKEFVESYKDGKRNFSNITLQFLDIANATFANIAIKDSRLFFCTFRDCSFKDVRFENCEIYFGSFYSGRVSNTIFEKCSIELTVFDNIQFDRTKMQRCSVRLSGILNSGLPDLSTSSQHRLITDLSQVTQQDIDEAISETLSSIARLDVSQRMKVREMMRKDAERYGLEKQLEGAEKPYAGEGALTYSEVKNLVELSFGYAQKNPYETKKPYERKDVYKGE